MPPVLVPLTNSILLSITTFVIVLFGYHLILKIFTLREAVNNLKLLSETAKNCDTDVNKNLGVKASIVAEIEGLIGKTRESFNFEAHYAELFQHFSKAVVYVFLMCILAFVGIILGILLTIGQAQNTLGSGTVWGIRIAFVMMLAVLSFMLWLLKDMPSRQPTIIWIGIVLMGGLVVGTSFISRDLKQPNAAKQSTENGAMSQKPQSPSMSTDLKEK